MPLPPDIPRRFETNQLSLKARREVLQKHTVKLKMAEKGYANQIQDWLRKGERRHGKTQEAAEARAVFERGIQEAMRETLRRLEQIDNSMEKGKWR